MNQFTLSYHRINFRFHLICLVLCLNFFANKLVGQTHNITITEVNYAPDSTRNSGDWLELYNYGNSAVDLSGWILTDIALNQFFNIPQGITIPANGYFVLCQDSSLFKSQYPGVTNFVGSFVWSLKHKKETINLFDAQNNLDVTFSYVDSLPWPKCADGHGRTMELKDRNGNLSDGNNWFAGCIGGSPGKAYSPCDEKIIISEINYNSSDNLDVGDWVEMRNIGTQVVDISGWKLVDKKDSAHFIIPANTVINSGDNFVFVKKMTKFKAAFPTVAPVIGPFTFSLGSDGDIVKLYDQQGKVIYSVYYNSLAPWPADAMETGKTLELLDSSKNVNEGTNWFAGCYGGSPGAYYSTPCLLGINGAKDNLFPSVLYPNPVNNNFYIEFNTDKLKNTADLKIIIYDVLGREIQNNNTISSDLKSGNFKIELSAKNLQNGIYFYQVQQHYTILGGGKFLVNH